MTKPIVYALVMSAMALTTGIAAAKGGGSSGTGMNGGSAPVTRQQSPDSKPQQIGFKKMKILNCHKHPRGNGTGTTVNWVTVCN